MLESVKGAMSKIAVELGAGERISVIDFTGLRASDLALLTGLSIAFRMHQKLALATFKDNP
jgi:hypothetical protein